jgi:hypothetical protein
VQGLASQREVADGVFGVAEHARQPGPEGGGGLSVAVADDGPEALHEFGRRPAHDLYQSAAVARRQDVERAAHFLGHAGGFGRGAVGRLEFAEQRLGEGQWPWYHTARVPSRPKRSWRHLTEKFS